LLKHLCNTFGIDFERVFLTNAVACFPSIKLSKEAYALASDCCSGRLQLELEALDNNIPVVALGHIAQQALGLTLRDRWMQEKFTGKWGLGTYHPAYTMREAADFVYLLEDMRKLTKPRRAWPEPPGQSEYAPGETYMVLPSGDNPLVEFATPAWLEFFDRVQGKGTCWEPTSLPDFATHPFFTKLGEDDLMCLDLETDQVNWHDDLILVFGLSKPAVPGGDPREVGTSILEIPQTVLYDEGFPRWLNTLFEAYGPRIGGHNIKFDTLFMHAQLGLAHPDKVTVGWDTILMLSILHDTWFRNLKEAVTYFFDVHDYESENVQYLSSKMDKFSKIPPHQITKYLIYDCHWNLMLAYELREQLKRVKLQRTPGKTQWEMPYLNLTMPLSEEFTAIELRGVAVDRDRVEQEWDALGKELKEISNDIAELTNGVVANANSTKQCAAYFYDVLKFPSCKVHKLSPRSTAKGALDVYKGKHPFIETLRHHRRVQKIRGSYCGQLRKNMWLDEEGVWRVFPRYLQYNVVTGRTAARGPSIQNWPRADDREEGQYGVRLKNCIIPRPGWALVAVDGSQWELRVVTVESADPYLVETYKAGVDFHGRMCDVLFGEGQWGKEDRGQEKRIMFAWVYGGTLESSLNVYEVAEGAKAEMGRRFNEQLQVLVAWRGTRLELAREQGFLESRMGRRSHFQLITDRNRKDVAKYAMNYPIQGPASDITLQAATRAGPQIRALGAYPIITIHDSIICETPLELMDEVVALAAHELEKAGREYGPEIPWVAEADVGGIDVPWGSLVEVDLKAGEVPSEIAKGAVL